MAGGLAGFASLSILVPVDLLKCRAQVHKDGHVKYSTIIKSLYHKQGVTGLYRGFSAFAIRQVPGTAVFFSTYQWMKDIGESYSLTGRWLFLWTLHSGGVAGASAWGISIP